MTQKTQRIGLLLLIGVLLSIILLTASLSNLKLHSGTPFPGIGSAVDARQPISSFSPQDTLSLPVVRGIFALFFLILLIYVPARLIVFVNFKKLFLFVLAMIVLLGLVTLIPRIAPSQSTSIPIESTEAPPPPAESYPVAPLGQPPRTLIQIVILVGAMGIGALVFIILRHSPSSSTVEEQLRQEAEDAVQALLSGSDLRNVIIRCYLQMTHALQEEQGIERNEHMTVREFENWLEFKGFPANPVHQLTSLFEKVRYGQQQISSGDETIAIESLNEIIQFCQSGSN
jgi:hypothetical protein